MIRWIFIGLLLSGVVQAQNIQMDLNREIENQFQKSYYWMSRNVHPEDSAPGAIVASPSRKNPEYYYHWVRDAAIVFDSLMDLYQLADNETQKQQFRRFFVNHLNLNQNLQMVPTLGGLGEPKFYPDGSAFNGPWGRPQNDGPGFRASTLIRLFSFVHNENWSNGKEIKTLIYDGENPTKSVAKKDLDYVAKTWTAPNFDLWEEVNGFHFYTLMVQRKALQLGVRLAKFANDDEAARVYQSELIRMNQVVGSFWDNRQGFIRATLFPRSSKLKREKSQLDSAVILALLHSDLSDSVIHLADDRVLSTFAVLHKTFSRIYPVNQKEQLGVAFGRYPEDTYDGYNTNSIGNPWVLTTAGAAEYMYRLIEFWASLNEVRVSAYNEAFFKDVLGIEGASNGQVWRRGSNEFKILMQKLILSGDKFMMRVLYHKNPDGSLSEQINRNSGFMQGAANLTWSYAAFMTAKLHRDRAYRILGGGLK